MAEYQLYCFAQSGNAYRAALMLNLIGADWEPIWVDFFGKGAPRWIIFDNQKVNGFLGPYRFLRCFAKPPGDPAVLAFLKGRIDNNVAILDKRLSSRPFVLGARPTIADLSLVAYLYYPAEEFGFDIPGQHKNIAVWLDRIKALPGWKHPYDLMPGHPLPGR